MTNIRDASGAVRPSADSLHEALELRQIAVYFQPIVSMQNDVTTVGVESLLRWWHPTRGLLTPRAFLTDAIASNAIEALGRFGIQRACEQIADWGRDGAIDVDFMLCVNVSRAEYEHLGGIAEAIEKSGIDRTIVYAEVSESEIATTPNPADMIEKLRAELGVGVVLDDCAIEDGSLDSLRRLPVDVVKVDAYELTRSYGELNRLEEFFSLAADRGLPVIVERVEVGAQAALLRERGCDLAQGYFFGAPTPIIEFDRRNSVERIRHLIRELNGGSSTPSANHG